MNTMTDPATQAAARMRHSPIPGESGLWVFLFADLVMFAALFAAVVFLWADQPEMFDSSQANLSTTLGTINTILLLTGSLFVARALMDYRMDVGNPDRLLVAAIACGIGFLVIKGFDWGGEFLNGNGPSTNEFFQLYFMLTGIHLIHVLIGLGALVAMRRSLRAGTASVRQFEGVASYWHLVDLLWVVLFPLLFLI